MAPSTRLRNHPERRVDYARLGSRANSIPLDDTPPPAARRIARTTQTARMSIGAMTSHVLPPSRRPGYLSDRLPLRSKVTRVDAGAVVKPRAPKMKARKAPAQAKKLPPPKRECSVCISTKSVSHSFRLDKNEETCEHFKNICGQCVMKMVDGKIESRQLSEADLACPYPDCDHVLDHADLKMAFMNKEKFKEYDAALAKHFLAANPTFIACLSPKCGKYFSVEDCSNKDTNNSRSKSGSSRLTSASNQSTKPEQIACPYCNFSLCLTCSRPWHAGKLCSAAADLEDASSLASIKALGAKPCPQCGINIEKQGGCDHMTCHRCHHNFCWQCLVPYTGGVVHAEGCSHGRRNVAIDPRNWVPDNMTDEQVNGVIDQARRRLDNPEQQQLDAPQLAGVPLAQNQGIQDVFANVVDILQTLLQDGD